MVKTKRLLSLDVFRGMTIMLMILVNTPGSWSHIYPPLRHADWHGMTPTDLVFPFFLYIMGVALWYSMKNIKSPLPKIWIKKVWGRTARLFGLGLILRAFPFYQMKLGSFRIMGVLQRIALTYALAAFLVYKLNQRQLVIVSIIILLGYWALLFFLGGDDPYSLEDNVVRRFDIQVFGEAHLWHGKKIAFDPEGLLSTLPATVTVILGYLSARIIKQQKRTSRAMGKLINYGILGIVVGGLWSFLLPLNKSLWTSSYVLMTGGIASLCLGLLVWVVEIKRKRRWTYLFKIFGVNPIFAFALSIVWVKILLNIKWESVDKTWNAYAWLYEKAFASWAGPMNGSLLFAIAHVAIIGVVLNMMYRRDIMIKI